MKASYVKILPCGSTVHSDHTEPCVDFVQEPIDREAYERDLRRRQDEHLKKVNGANWRPCLHDGCEQCHGTGRKLDGTPCIHMISCPCPKCSPTSM